jgi:hypothetical protein
MQQQQQHQQNGDLKANLFKSPTSSTLISNSQNQKSQQHQTINNNNNNSNKKVSLVRKSSNKNLNINPMLKKKTNGYCECCKQRFENLKQVRH